jgi:hypothetical protein
LAQDFIGEHMKEFLPFSMFFTNDDFFLLKISQAKSISDFLRFFDFTKGPEGLGFYRPLTTQAFYFLAWVFKLNPLVPHLLSFLTFLAVCYLVFRLTQEIFKKKSLALTATFLYAVSATHFGHFYYLATYQELGMTFFYLLSTLLFLKKKYFLSLLAFTGALLSKETAVVLPLTHLLLLWYFKEPGKIRKTLPFLGVLGVYLYLHTFHYGFAAGDSYIWNFAPLKAGNTLFWYSLWSLNLPEMLVDFVGPGLKVSVEPLRFWFRYLIPIFILFSVITAWLLVSLGNFLKKMKKDEVSILILASAWFVLTLAPVLFLPLHKFTFYLTLPLIGVIWLISYILEGKGKPLFLALWLALSIFTLTLTYKTHWITQGSRTAKLVYEYVKNNESALQGKTIVFHDTEEDKKSPWLPSGTLKVILSENNFFAVFFNGKIEAVYGNGENQEDVVQIRARNFLFY